MNEFGEIFIVATPIGNLEDITLRALKILKEVSLILAEDTRTTKKLLEKYGIKKKILSYHQHSKPEKINFILELLNEGEKIAFLSEAGTPGISDPGGELIQKIIENYGEKVKIIPIPGPSALTAAISISGFPMNRFLFLGFCPKKKKRKKFFEEIIESKYPVIFYESPYRVLKTLSQLKEIFEQRNQSERKIVVCRELTKKFETIYRGNVVEVLEKIQKDKIKGEFVIIIDRLKNKKI